MSSPYDTKAPDEAIAPNGIKTTNISSIGGLTKLSEAGLVIPTFDDVQVTYVSDALPLEQFVSQVYGYLLGLNYVLAPEVRACP